MEDLPEERSDNSLSLSISFIEELCEKEDPIGFIKTQIMSEVFFLLKR